MKDITLSIESRLENVRLLRAAVRGLGDEAALSSQSIGSLELCVAEAVDNCIEHAYAGQDGHGIRVRWVQDGSKIAIYVYDEGRSMDPAHLVAQAIPSLLEVDPANPDSLGPRGRGLLFIHRIMSEVSYDREGGYNRLHMLFDPDRSHARQP
jgi:serine/threonine-protein kinase RsbW